MGCTSRHTIRMLCENSFVYRTMLYGSRSETSDCPRTPAASRAPGQPPTLTGTQHRRMSAHARDVYIHVARLRMHDHLMRLIFDNELPPAEEVERALWRAIYENWWEKRVSDSFRTLMRAIIERAVKRRRATDAYEAICLLNRSYVEHTNEAIRRSRPERYYVQDKLEWISYKLARRIERDWSLKIDVLGTLRHRIAPEQYQKLLTNALRHRTTTGGRANSEPRIRKKKRAEIDSSHTNATCIVSMGKYLTVGRSSSTQKKLPTRRVPL